MTKVDHAAADPNVPPAKLVRMAAYPVGLKGLFVKLFPRHQISLVTERGDFLRRKYGRYGYRRVCQLLLPVGLKVPTKT